MPESDHADKPLESPAPFGPGWKRPLNKRLGSRFVLWFYNLWHPKEPKLALEAVRRIAELLPTCRQGLEWGSGRSTLWLADRLAALTSVENNRKWHRWVTKRLQRRGASHAECLLRTLNVQPRHKAPYVRVADQFEDGSIDFCLVDGRARVHCANAAVEKMAPGGILVLDDAQRYMAADTDGGVRLTRQPDVAEEWEDFLHATEGWPCEWYPNPVRSTAIWIRPAD